MFTSGQCWALLCVKRQPSFKMHRMKMVYSVNIFRLSSTFKLWMICFVMLVSFDCSFQNDGPQLLHVWSVRSATVLCWMEPFATIRHYSRRGMYYVAIRNGFFFSRPKSYFYVCRKQSSCMACSSQSNLLYQEYHLLTAHLVYERASIVIERLNMHFIIWKHQPVWN